MRSNFDMFSASIIPALPWMIPSTHSLATEPAARLKKTPLKSPRITVKLSSAMKIPPMLSSGPVVRPLSHDKRGGGGRLDRGLQAHTRTDSIQ